MSQKKMREQIGKTQKEMIAYERSHKLSAKAQYKMNKAQDALARARYAHIGEDYDTKLAEAQKVLDFIEQRGIRGIAFGGGVPGLD